MPQVPVYDQQQVGRQPLQGGEQRIQADPNAFGAVQGQQLSQLGAAAGQASDALARIQERDDKSELMDTESRVKAAYADWAANEAKNVGQAAKGAGERAKDWWKTTAQETAKNIKSPQAQQMFMRAAQNQAIAATRHFASHENQQMELVSQQTMASNINASIDLASKIPTDENIKAQQAAIAGALQVYGSGRWSPETLKDETSKAVSAMNMAVFNNLYTRDPIGAENYYKANRNNILGTHYDEIEAKLKVGVADAEGANAARAAVALATKGLKATDPLPQEDIDAKLVEQLGSKPESLKAARAELDRVSGLRDHRVAKVEANALKTINAAYAAGTTTLAALKRLPQWAQLSGTAQLSMSEHINDRNHMLWARSIEDKNRIAAEQLRNLAPAMLVMSQPDNLVRNSADDIMRMLPTIGAANVEMLLKKRQDLVSNQVKLSVANLDNDTFNSALAAAGKDPKPNHNNKDAAALVWRTREAVENAVSALQQSKGRELTRQEKDVEIKRVVNSKLLEPGWFGRTGEVNEIDLTPEKLANAMVPIQVQGKPGQMTEVKIPLSSVPADEFSDTQRYLRERGQPYSTADVVKRWYHLKTTKAK